MDLWLAWTALVQHLLQIFATDLGLGSGLAVIVLTLAFRGALLPLTWSMAYRAALRQETLERLKPQLAALRERYASEPAEQAARTLELYRQHGVPLADSMSVLALGVQLPVLWGLYQVLRDKAAGAFMWIRDLGRPDTGLAVITALITAAAAAVSLAVAPHVAQGAAEPLRMAVVLLPAILCFMAALHFSAGLALYWSTSNLFGAFQTVAVHGVLRQRRRRRPA